MDPVFLASYTDGTHKFLGKALGFTVDWVVREVAEPKGLVIGTVSMSFEVSEILVPPVLSQW